MTCAVIRSCQPRDQFIALVARLVRARTNLATISVHAHDASFVLNNETRLFYVTRRVIYAFESRHFGSPTNINKTIGLCVPTFDSGHPEANIVSYLFLFLFEVLNRTLRNEIFSFDTKDETRGNEVYDDVSEPKLKF